MQSSSASPSRLPMLRQDRPPHNDGPQPSGVRAGGRQPSTSLVSNSTIASANRALRSGGGGNSHRNSTRSHDSYHTSSSPSDASGAVNFDAASRDISQHHHLVGASDNSSNISNSKQSAVSATAATTTTAARLRLPPTTLPHPLPREQPSAHVSPLNTPTPAARLSHLEQTGQLGSLPPQLYLPELQPAGAALDTLTPPMDGLVALQDATTGLFVRHVTLEDPAAAEKEASVTTDTAITPTDTDHTKSPTTPRATYESARAEALMKATPLVSAALLDAGVDDRINPFLLDKMIRQGHRRVAAVAAAAAAAKAAAAEAKRKADSGRMYPAPSYPAVAAPAAAPKGPRTSADRSGKAARAADETRFHEPPALQSAYNVVSLPVVPANAAEKEAERREDLVRAAKDADAFAEILAEYANDAQDEEAACNPRSAALLEERQLTAKRGQTSTQSHKTLLLMSSPDYTRFASAASANDAAFIRQLVSYYYTTRTRAAAAAADSQKWSETGTKPVRVALTSTTLEAAVKGATGSSVDPLQGYNDTVAWQRAASLRANEVEANKDFSMLDAVLSVSREYVEVQASEMGVPGKGTAALSERRRDLLRKLITLDQTRIPDSLWVTCAPPLSRLATLTSSSPQAAANRANLLDASTAAADREQDATSTGSLVGASGAFMAALTGPAAAAAGEKARRFSEQARPSIVAASIVATQSEDSMHYGHRSQAAVNPAAAATSSNTIFPAVRPTERSQVYLLADVLDRMLHDPSHPQWVELLSNPEMARYVFAADGDAAAEAFNFGNDNDVSASLRMNPETEKLAEALWGPPGDQRLMAYTDAALQVLDILDTGLSELVRQVACHCTERGALLDLLRQSVVDITTTQVHLLGQVKQQARQDAANAVTLRAENKQLREQLSTARRELAELAETHTQLLDRIDPIQRKSDRLDELMARVASKARRFETHRQDEHIALLQLLEESMKQKATSTVDSFYNEVNDMYARHAGEDHTDTSTHGGIPLLMAAEMPSVTAARAHAAEQRQTMERMYTESHKLLNALQDIVAATNAACSPLYQKMMLTDVSPVAKVATSRWTTVARAVGAFEKERRHRLRVYEVFTEYCTVFRHEQAAASAAAAAAAAAQSTPDANNSNGVKRQASNETADDSNTFTTATLQSHGESFLVEQRPSQEKTTKTKKRDGDDGDGTADGTDADAESNDDLIDVNNKVHSLQRSLAQPPAQTDPASSSTSRGTANPLGTIITQKDLVAMSATDCTVDEVNALFRNDLDVRAYLRGSWEDYIRDRRLQETAAGVDDTYTLRLPDLLQMLCDMHVTLAEVTLRMRAMAESGVLQTLLRPPLEPPAHPEVPCPLCCRRDTCEMDRRRRREAMSRIARDLQGKMDAVEAKSRAAQLERDEAKREVRRLKMELQQVSQGNASVPSAGNSSPSSASLHNARDSSMPSFRRGRRGTSTPREPPFDNSGGQDRKGSVGTPRSQRPRQSRRKSSTGETLSPPRRSTTKGGADDSDNNDSAPRGPCSALHLLRRWHRARRQV
ncbi:hypothetical protein ABB37_07775 [Leptomonas pyrrhocoris]|uniref:Uncharacterized protein n=1 Tax=Leptomonas pyrrhocoris TaxID=157538 RepID=A0A0N0DT26_LEPPY|nr:hypothetical protein ABB37_07775 [Leptomonas pyrrhocoris]XP_015654893.1 hypothetical protein ABB37_07775 [Leptomonas pyrrhocoris]KPA76453.1 hypothetical protein ABB37_07775 [Leptomonas pyrrhocoris]KPA76454.1 hypothetical protein ABB37_07775 [Leptomonas pyrrhocoris]|eukprot:XP_015654892.1 hypothetical protein ABB37_07775 [Leptomonas pyrrhocoris]